MTPGSLQGREGKEEHGAGSRSLKVTAAWEKEEQRQRKLRGSGLGSSQMQDQGESPVRCETECLRECFTHQMSVCRDWEDESALFQVVAGIT